MEINTNMQEQINNLTKQVELLTNEVTRLKDNFPLDGIKFEELIRDTVFFDKDLTSRTQSYAVTGGGGGSVVSVKTPSYYLKGYFRGNVIYIGIYTT